MIRIGREDEIAFDRVIKANAFNQLEAIFKREKAIVDKQYDQAKDALVMGGDRTVALLLRGRRDALAEILDLFERQRV